MSNCSFCKVENVPLIVYSHGSVDKEGTYGTDFVDLCYKCSIRADNNSVWYRHYFKKEIKEKGESIE